MLMLGWVRALPTLLFATSGAGEQVGAEDVGAGYEEASEFTEYVTRPEIKAPLFDVITHGPADSITPGYWFVAPYLFLVSRGQYEPRSKPCTIGPMIYDNAGELVWSGACLVNSTNTFDFRAWHSDGDQFLSAILDSQTDTGVEHSQAITIDHRLQVTSRYQIPDSWTDVVLNMHEFNPVNDGKAALHIIQRSIETDVTGVEHSTGEKVGRIVDNGFAEVDLSTREVLFEWWASDHIPLSASSGVVAGLTQKAPRGWNWIHLNSVDKDQYGDYLVSARYTNAIYKISGKTGDIIWTLGGQNSSFALQGLNFSRQHDARFVSQNDGIEVISFLDNGGDDHFNTAVSSSGVLVALNTTLVPMSAAVVKRWVRPSEGVSKQRGNFQILLGGNVFIGWSDKCHVTEHASSGELLMEAKWKKQMSNTYRAWKFNFTSDPAEDPILKLSIQSRKPSPIPKTVFHVSWNGATEVASWNFRRSTRSNGLIGSRKKRSFETTLEAAGCESKVYAEAVSKDGKILRRTAIEIASDPDNLCSSITRKQQLSPEEIFAAPRWDALSSIDLDYAILAVFATMTIILAVSCVRWIRRR